MSGPPHDADALIESLTVSLSPLIAAYATDIGRVPGGSDGMSAGRKRSREALGRVASGAFLLPQDLPIARQSPREALGLVERITEVSHKQGLTDDQLASLSSLLSVGGVPTRLAVSILRAMVPLPSLLATCSVDERHCVTMVGGFGDMEVAARRACLDWIVHLLDRFSSTARLSSLSPAFFSCLGYETLRGPAAYILCRVGGRGAVLGWRVRAVEGMLRGPGGGAPGHFSAASEGDKALWALLAVYDSLRPGCTTCVTPVGFSVHRAFKVPNRGWFSMIEDLADRHESEAAESLEEKQRGQDGDDTGGSKTVTVNTGSNTGSSNSHNNSSAIRIQGVRSVGSGSSASKSNVVIPPATTADAPVVVGGEAPRDAVTANEMTTLESLCESLRSAVLPDRLGSSLASRPAQHLVMLHSGLDKGVGDRLSAWIGFHLQRLFTWAAPPGAQPGVGHGSAVDGKGHSSHPGSGFLRRSRFLAAVARLSAVFQQTPPDADHFLCRDFLPQWDGDSDHDSVMTLVANLTPRSYESLYGDVLRPMHSLFVTGTVEWRAGWIETLGRLVASWASVDWKTWRDTGDTAWDNSPFPFSPPQRSVDYYRVIRSLLSHADHLCALALQDSSDHPTVQCAVAGFMSVAARMRRDWGLPFVAPPSRVIVYRFLFSPTSLGPALMAGSLAEYLGEFKSLIEFREKTAAARESGVADPTAGSLRRREHMDDLELGFPSGIERIEDHNGYVLDFTRALWKRRAFGFTGSSAGNAQASVAASRLREPEGISHGLPPRALGAALSVFCSPAFASLSRRFLTERGKRCEAGSGSIVPLDFTRDKALSIEYVDWLSEHGHGGVGRFLHEFMNLGKRTNNKSQE